MPVPSDVSRVAMASAFDPQAQTHTTLTFAWAPHWPLHSLREIDAPATTSHTRVCADRNQIRWCVVKLESDCAAVKVSSAGSMEAQQRAHQDSVWMSRVTSLASIKDNG